MPRGNGAGPAGAGHMTGRGLGFCAGNGMPGFAAMVGRGYSRGAGCSGRGAGFRNRFFSTGLTGWERTGKPPFFAAGLTADEERDALSRQASVVEERLAGLKKRISELESKKTADDGAK